MYSGAWDLLGKPRKPQGTRFTMGLSSIGLLAERHYKNRKTCPVRHEKWPNPVVEPFGEQQHWRQKPRRVEGVDEEPHLEEIALLERPARSEEGEASSGVA